MHYLKLSPLGVLLMALAMPALAIDQHDDTGTLADEKAAEANVDAVIGGGDSERPDVMYGELVKDIYAPRISSFRAIDNQRVLIYTTPFKPYLLTLNRKASGLVFEDRLALKYNNNRIYTRFDAVVVDGIPYHIKRIEKLDRETARSLGRKDKDKDKDKRGEEDEQEPVETEGEAQA